MIEDLLLEEGEIYNPFLQNRDRSVISEVYHEQGYAFVRVIPETKIHDDTKTVDVNYRVVKGEKAYFGRLPRSLLESSVLRRVLIRRL